MSVGLSNPVALATIASSKQGQKAIGQGLNALKVLLLVGGGIFAANLAYNKYKEYRAEKYARNNAGNPNLIAAAVIYNSFTRFDFPGPLGFLLSSIDISTDEAALNNIATQVTDIQAVSDAYKILFDRTLFFDTQNGLDTEELQTFWNTIKAPNTNNSTTAYPIGTKLYSAKRQGLNIINTAAQDASGNWHGTDTLYNNFSFNELVGKVIATGIVDANDALFAGQRYYIVVEIIGENCLFTCNKGVVVQSQVTNKQV